MATLMADVEDHDAAPTREGALTKRIFEHPEWLMRMVYAWPESSPFALAISRIAACGSMALMVTARALEIFWGDFENVVTFVGCFTDVTAGSVIIVKALAVFKHGTKILTLRNSLQQSFAAIENMASDEAYKANLRAINRSHFLSRMILTLYVPLVISGIFICVSNMFLSSEVRQLNVKTPSFVTQTDWIYWPLAADSFVMFATFLTVSAGYDSLFLSICVHIQSKCEILQTLFRHICQRAAGHGGDKMYEYWNDDGSDFALPPTPQTTRTDRDVHNALIACVEYHQLIITLRDLTEGIYANVTLFLISYLLMGLGIPALLIHYDKSMDFHNLIFMILYTTWNFTQLLMYCWFADGVAESSGEVSVAAYAALRPDIPSGRLSGLTARDGAVLNLLTLRAQRPLYLTAGRFVNLSLTLYLDLIRRTQSLYSYMLKIA